MKTYEEQTADLNEAQRKAVEIQRNAVVAAGAGSGKTKVLAARFLHLVTQKKIPVDEILALTFTRKAAAEMRTRIYSVLMETSEAEAKKAADVFHAAKIDTLDSFCASICRDACRTYGVPPDFTIDDDMAVRIAEKKALEFILQHRSSPAIRSLLKKFALKDLPSRLFADIMTKYSCISSPLNFQEITRLQSEKIHRAFTDTTHAIATLVEALKNLPEPEQSGETWQKLKESLSRDFEIPDAQDRAEIQLFVKNCLEVDNVPNRVLAAKDIKNELRTETRKLLSLANYILNEDIIQETFGLLSEFQEIFNDEKRGTGILTFRDISQMAVDALLRDEGLRDFYKTSITSIMIDEFQDNNDIQRDLLYLLSEKKADAEQTANTKKIPGAENLTQGKLFFVGDEKQSIYLFRGADVSVFRKLKTDLGDGTDMPQLTVNYRTEKPLLEIFNAVFPHVFLSKENVNPVPQYEAEFLPIETCVSTRGCTPGFDILMLAEENFKTVQQNFLGKTETEAAEVAQRIKTLVAEKFQVRDESSPGKTRNCTYSDVAILFRTTSKQKQFERSLREFGIPYQSEAVSDLFSDAPANDIYAFLRLAVNPEDGFSYSVVLRSPFVSADDETFTRILLARAAHTADDTKPHEPFSSEDTLLVTPECRERFNRAAALYNDIKDHIDNIPAAELVSKLWYEYGYRYNTILDPDLIYYAEIYDYLFELARQADADSNSLAEFLDKIEEKKSSGMKFDEIDIPAGKTNGVHLLTVHKSKGLEFPVVFIVDAGSSSRVETNDKPFYFSHEHSITINTDTPEELRGLKAKDKADAGSNFFYKEAKEENNAKALAELRRLLYVAVTRAEIKIVISGSFELTKDEPVTEPRTEKQMKEILQNNFSQNDSQRQKETPSAKTTFFDLLLPAVIKGGNKTEGIRIFEIMPKERVVQKQRRQKREQRMSSTTPIVNYTLSEKNKFTASSLHSILNLNAMQTSAQNTSDNPNDSATRDERDTCVVDACAPTHSEYDAYGKQDGRGDSVDDLLQTCGVNPAEFGTYVHAAIEEGFTGKPARIPAEVRAEVQKLAAGFFKSEIGGAAKRASWKKIEYGFLTRMKINGLPDDAVIAGKMDLLFEADGKLYIVDYKTDRIENPGIHAPQLHLYVKAAEKLFGTIFPGARITPLLYYLRSGHVVEVE